MVAAAGLPAKPKASLRREFGAATAVAVVIANMIGSGIFTTSGFVARDLGSPAWLVAVWLAGGLIALTGALSYAELGAAMPHAGGEYVYLRAAYGPFVAFLSGWTSFFIGFSGAIAAATLAFADYLHQVFPWSHFGKVVALVALWAITAAHISGPHPSGLVQRIFAATTVTAMVSLVVCAFAFGHGSMSHFASLAPARGNAAVSLIFVLYAYSGWNAAAYIAGEIRDARCNLPRALISGTVAVTLLYLAMNAMYLYALPIAAMSGVLTIGEKAAVTLFGRGAAHVVAAILALTILGSASAMVIAGPRVYFAMARDGLLPAGVGALDIANATPRRAILAQSMWASVLIVFFGAFEPLVVYAGFALVIFTALAVAAVVVLRLRQPYVQRPFQTPAYPWVPVVHVALSIWIIGYTFVSRPTEAALGLLTVSTGAPIYLLWKMHQPD